MEATGSPTTRPHPVTQVRRSLRWSRDLHLLLIAGWLVVVATGLLAGAHRSSLDRLERDISSGKVHLVKIAGDDLGSGAHDSTVQLVTWRTGPIRHFVEVSEKGPAAARSSYTSDDQRATISGDLTQELESLHSGLRVRHDGELRSYSEFKGWRMPDWTGPLMLVLGLFTLGALIAGLQPRRATKWAWWWLMGIATPLGVIAFLVLGATARPISEEEAARRFTGGWAFLLAFVANSLLSIIFFA